MKRDDEGLRMWFSLMTSIVIHVAIILLVPVLGVNRITIYPVEFGEISQAFEAPRRGSAEGKVSAAPERETKPKEEKGQEIAAMEKGAVQGPAVAPTPPADKAKVEPRPEPKAAPVDEVKPPPKQEEQSAPKEGKPAQMPETKPQAVAEKPPLAAKDEGRVLTGDSDETIPISKSEAPSEKALPPTPPESDGSGGQGGEDRAAVASPERESIPPPSGKQDASPKPAAVGGGAGEPGVPGEPSKPRGHEFGTGESLAIVWTRPQYPKDAQNLDATGTVELGVLVDTTGKVTQVVVVQGSGARDLDNQAVRHVMTHWQFRGIGWPYRLTIFVSFMGGVDVEVTFGGVVVLGEGAGPPGG